jgi:hypothetical protein
MTQQIQAKAQMASILEQSDDRELSNQRQVDACRETEPAPASQRIHMRMAHPVSTAKIVAMDLAATNRRTTKMASTRKVKPPRNAA